MASCRLHVLAQLPLYGTVEDVAVLRARVPGQKDSIVLAFRCGTQGQQPSAAHGLASWTRGGGGGGRCTCV